MASYEFKLMTLNRYHLREDGSDEMRQLNGEGAQGWHIIVIREDPRDGSNLIFFMERQVA
jgi:hypothetical protein